MIIKFQERDKWVMFGEIDHIEYESMKFCKEGAVESEISSGTICYESPKDDLPHAYYEVAFFTKNMIEATVIRCWTPIYVMNDNGRTVEII